MTWHARLLVMASPRLCRTLKADQEGDEFDLRVSSPFVVLLLIELPVPQVNLRKDELAYRTDYSYLRGKVGYLAAAVLLILAFAAINGRYDY